MTLAVVEALLRSDVRSFTDQIQSDWIRYVVGVEYPIGYLRLLTVTWKIIQHLSCLCTDLRETCIFCTTFYRKDIDYRVVYINRQIIKLWCLIFAYHFDYIWALGVGSRTYWSPFCPLLPLVSVCATRGSWTQPLQYRRVPPHQPAVPCTAADT